MERKPSGCFVCLPMGKLKANKITNGKSEANRQTPREARAKELELAAEIRRTVNAEAKEPVETQDSPIVVDIESSDGEMGLPLPLSHVKEKPSKGIENRRNLSPVISPSIEKEKISSLLSEKYVEETEEFPTFVVSSADLPSENITAVRESSLEDPSNLPTSILTEEDNLDGRLLPNPVEVEETVIRLKASTEPLGLAIMEGATVPRLRPFLPPPSTLPMNLPPPLSTASRDPPPPLSTASIDPPPPLSTASIDPALSLSTLSIDPPPPLSTASIDPPPPLSTASIDPPPPLSASTYVPPSPPSSIHPPTSSLQEKGIATKETDILSTHEPGVFSVAPLTEIIEDLQVKLGEKLGYRIPELASMVKNLNKEDKGVPPISYFSTHFPDASTDIPEKNERSIDATSHREEAKAMLILEKLKQSSEVQVIPNHHSILTTRESSQPLPSLPFSSHPTKKSSLSFSSSSHPPSQMDSLPDIPLIANSKLSLPSSKFNPKNLAYSSQYPPVSTPLFYPSQPSRMDSTSYVDTPPQSFYSHLVFPSAFLQCQEQMLDMFGQHRDSSSPHLSKQNNIHQEMNFMAVPTSSVGSDVKKEGSPSFLFQVEAPTGYTSKMKEDDWKYPNMPYGYPEGMEWSYPPSDLEAAAPQRYQQPVMPFPYDMYTQERYPMHPNFFTAPPFSPNSYPNVVTPSYVNPPPPSYVNPPPPSYVNPPPPSYVNPPPPSYVNPPPPSYVNPPPPSYVNPPPPSYVNPPPPSYVNSPPPSYVNPPPSSYVNPPPPSYVNPPPSYPQYLSHRGEEPASLVYPRYLSTPYDPHAFNDVPSSPRWPSSPPLPTANLPFYQNENISAAPFRSKNVHFMDEPPTQASLVDATDSTFPPFRRGIEGSSPFSPMHPFSSVSPMFPPMPEQEGQLPSPTRFSHPHNFASTTPSANTSRHSALPSRLSMMKTEQGDPRLATAAPVRHAASVLPSALDGRHSERLAPPGGVNGAFMPVDSSSVSSGEEAILIPSADGEYTLYTLTEFTTLCKEKGVPGGPALKVSRNDNNSIQSALYVAKHILGNPSTSSLLPPSTSPVLPTSTSPVLPTSTSSLLPTSSVLPPSTSSLLPTSSVLPPSTSSPPPTFFRSEENEENKE